MKSHCLRPLPPADPAPARPLEGICLGGGSGFQPGNRPRSPPSHFCRGGDPAPVASPLLPPTAAGENSCPRGRGPRLYPVDPQGHSGAHTGGDREEGCGALTTDAPGTCRPARGAHPGVAGSRAGPTGAPWCPTRGISHSFNWPSRSCPEKSCLHFPRRKLSAAILSFFCLLLFWLWF